MPRAATSVGHRGDEGVERHAALGASDPRAVDPDGAGGHVVVAHHEHVGHLLELPPADPGAERLVGRRRPRPRSPAADSRAGDRSA